MQDDTSTFDRFLTEHQEKALLKTLRGRAGWQAQRDLHAINLMRASGIRISTLCGLTVADARESLSADTLTLRDEICKGGRGYSLPMTARIEVALRGLLRLRRDLGLGVSPDAPLLVSRTRNNGQGMTPRAVQLRFRHWCQEAGITAPATPHWLRHTLAQRIVRDSTARDPLAMAARVLNHGDINTTRIYTRPSMGDVRQAMRESAQ